MKPTQYRLSSTLNANWQRLDYTYYGDGRVVREALVGGPSPSAYYMVRSMALGGGV